MQQMLTINAVATTFVGNKIDFEATKQAIGYPLMAKGN